MALKVLWVPVGGDNGTPNQSRSVLRLLVNLRPDVLVLDAMELGAALAEFSRQARRQLPELRVIALCDGDEAEDCAPASAHADFGAVILKQGPAKHLVSALRGVPYAPSEGPRRHSMPDRLAVLTARERQVLPLAAAGHTSAAIGRRLFISARTVERHRANVMRKLEVTNQTELLCLALRSGVIELGEHDLIVHDLPGT